MANWTHFGTKDRTNNSKWPTQVKWHKMCMSFNKMFINLWKQVKNVKFLCLIILLGLYTQATSTWPTTTDKGRYSTRKPKGLWHGCQHGRMPSELNPLKLWNLSHLNVYFSFCAVTVLSGPHGVVFYGIHVTGDDQGAGVGAYIAQPATYPKAFLFLLVRLHFPPHFDFGKSKKKKKKKNSGDHSNRSNEDLRFSLS